MNEKAIEEYNKAIETQPRKAISYFQLADLYRVNNRQEEAIAKLRKGISLTSMMLRLMTHRPLSSGNIGS